MDKPVTNMPEKQTDLEWLEMRGDFTRRHIGPDPDQIKTMLNYLQLDSLDQIIDRAVPKNILSDQPLSLQENISERAVITYLRKLRERNQVNHSMIGMGYHGTILPHVIKRNVLENPGWYTAYTPYQPEISQGRLEALINFQQMIIDLTGMQIANASMLDEATAAAEAMTMSRRVNKSDANGFFVDQDCHPQTIAVIQTRARPFGYQVIVGDPYNELKNHKVFGVLLQYPGSSGEVRQLDPVIEQAHAQGALVTVAADILSLVLLKPPGESDADIVVGSSQRFGVSMGYGGPHAGFYATREKFIRQVPGRIIGVSRDTRGEPAYRMTLQTREQHIRREKATSNICTSQSLLAIIAGFYAIYHGPEGLQQIATRVHRYMAIFVTWLKSKGYNVTTNVFFDTITLSVPGKARRLAAHAREKQINVRVVDKNTLGISFDETTTRTLLRTLSSVFAATEDETINIEAINEKLTTTLPDEVSRQSEFLQHRVFNQYHSETEMMRYMRRLARKDIALDSAMIPLGSCTMKLNATVELQALSYREFSAMHPFVPLEQAQGYMQMLTELQEMLCDLTGFDAFSFQPNAGSQGEYAGLLVIRKYFESIGEADRNICLIPASAHGTNPASASMAGLEIVIVHCDEQGNVDINDLRDKAKTHGDRLAALMITYPSTHGVYEEAFRDICDLVHEHGGQVYLDGANFNALVGISRPGHIGADVAHLNLHKTFAIPHGGGGPGAGPIGVRNHLSPFLPDHPVVQDVNPDISEEFGSIGTVAAAPWGSASILSISWAYIAMMRETGLMQATMVALLNANYISKRLSEHYPILYRGKNGLVAHECIIDLRQIKADTGITVDDVAKRLIDYGFHAPTMSFPVADTLMIEPTESENKRELDRFCEAMIAIRKEIEAVKKGELDRENNPLKNAPHHHSLFINADWELPYSKQLAFFPMQDQSAEKYWPPVSRIDNPYGDKNLFCSCIQ